MTEQKIEMIVTFPIYKPFRRLNESFRNELTKALKSVNPRFRPKYRPVVEELNQFLFSSVSTENSELIEIPSRIDVEDRVDAVYNKFSAKILKQLHKLYKKDPELRNSLIALTEANKDLGLNLDEDIDKIKNLPDYTVEEIEKIYKNGSLIIWDMPGAEIDRIIAGYEKINREDDSLSEADIGIVSDELALATFGKEHVPSLIQQINHITDTLSDLPKQVTQFKSGFTSVKNEHERNLIIEVTSVFLGKLLGIREPTSLAQKQLQRYLDLEEELREEGKKIGSNFLKEIYSKFMSSDDIRSVMNKIEAIEKIVSDNSEEIRQVLTNVEEIEITGKTSEIVRDFVKFVAHIYLHLEMFRFITDTFQDIPSFTAMGGGVAMETGYTGDFQVPEDIAIYIKDVFRTFPLINSTVYALRGADLEVKKGEFIAIMGPSGSGKTTLLNIMSSLDHPDRGIVYVDGINLNTANESQLVQFRRDNVAFIYQSYNLLPVLMNRENVSLPADFGTKANIGNKKKRAGQLLDDVGIGQFKKGKPLLLSGGQQQRVTIARALMNKANILFCDEPTGDLDSVTGDQVMDIIEDLNKEGVTIVLVTHDERVAKRAHRIVLMSDGKTID
ncbi:MAG: ABC transporter ATP-binding protein [Candidatus Kariarchaeaceae archaeon]|jgi:putative ABC transport system ATP-binding protein